MINNLVKIVHDNAIRKGFHDDETNIPALLCLVHSEISEALEADRSGIYTSFKNGIKINDLIDLNNEKYDDIEMFKKYFLTYVKDSFEDELADVVIRIMDIAGLKGIDLESHIKAKIRFNSTRGYKHGKKY